MNEDLDNPKTFPKTLMEFPQYSRTSFFTFRRVYLDNQRHPPNRPYYNLQTVIIKQTCEWIKGICWYLFYLATATNLSIGKVLNVSQSEVPSSLVMFLSVCNMLGNIDRTHIKCYKTFTGVPRIESNRSARLSGRVSELTELRCLQRSTTCSIVELPHASLKVMFNLWRCFRRRTWE